LFTLIELSHHFWRIKRQIISLNAEVSPSSRPMDAIPASPLGGRAASPGLLGTQGAYVKTIEEIEEMRQRKHAHFLSKMRSNDEYKALVGKLGPKAAKDSLDSLCSACWQLCEESTTIEAVSLKGQLQTINLNAQKQICAMRATVTHEDQEWIDFYEPLQHVDPVSRDLVLHTVVDKLQQLESATIPESTAQKLIDYVKRCKVQLRGDEETDDEPGPSLVPRAPGRSRKPTKRAPSNEASGVDVMEQRVDRIERVCETLEDENDELMRRLKNLKGV